jgi:carbon storage regulator
MKPVALPGGGRSLRPGAFQTRKESPMLVLSRKPNETLRIGDDIYVTILRLSDGIVRLGIEAPRDVMVLRTELIENAESQ